MATTYIGFYNPAPDSPANASWRDTGSFSADFAKKVNEFPAKLPATCKLIGSWAISGPSPSVLIIEAESFADILHVNQYYAGWLDFDWHPTTSVPRNN